VCGGRQTSDKQLLEIGKAEKEERMEATTKLYRIVLLMLFILAAVGLAAAQTWKQVSPSGTAPLPRLSGNQGYDATHDRFILYGGESYVGGSDSRLNDVWVVSDATGNSPAWHKLTTAGAAPLAGYGVAPVLGTTVYDSTSNRLIVYGGCAYHCGYSVWDTWVLTNANGLEEGVIPTWSKLTTGAGYYEGRAEHSAAYDAINNRMIVFGGHMAYFNTDQNNVLVLVDANGIGNPHWIHLSPTGTAPPVRRDSSVAYDPETNRLIVFGGQAYPQADVVSNYNDVWVLTNANGLGEGTPTWIQLTPTGDPPTARGGHSVVYNPTTRRLVLFGGYHDNRYPYNNFPANDYFNDVWVLTEANGVSGTPQWTQLSPGGTSPHARIWHSYGYSEVSDKVLIAMGYSEDPNQQYMNDVWLLTFNQPPVAVAGTDKDLIVYEVAQFDGSTSYDPDAGGSITAYLWDFGDGETSGEAVTSHAFNAPGTYTVNLTVTDDQGATNTAQLLAHVHDVTYALNLLTDTVAGFNLKKGISNALDSKIQNVLAAFSAANAGDRQDVKNKLQAFINSVEAQRAKELTNAEADALESLARRILGVL
jgi:PKD domain/Kelch motif